MAVVYRGSNLMIGLSSDPKPTLAVDKAVFFETDTTTNYDFDLGTTTWIYRSAGHKISSLMTYG